ncbi:MAG: ATP-dependent Clp protease proteolytic subunit [Bacilli bacterium]|nr:ATP-dependent Clp protease proteolytic subunit [Bacilli bacterium]
MSKTRIINLNGTIDEINAINVIVKLLDLDSESHEEPIQIYINSNGGSIVHGLAIYDTMKHIQAPVYTTCTGLCASMGAFLLSCGEKGHRTALKHSRILIHQPLISSRAGMMEKESELRKIAHDLQKRRESLEKIMAENSGQTIKRLHEDCERDNWMSAEEALAYGLIDEII